MRELRFPFAEYGYRELFVFSSGFCLMALLSGYFVWPPLAVPFALLALFVFWFFRDPHRAVPPDESAVVSPADGTVTDITELDDAEFIGGPALRIGIFLSVLSVHINRAPCAGVVAYIRYHKGKFLNAMRAESSSDNESNSVGMILPSRGDRKILVKQITGAIARRIVCTCEPGDQLARGQKFGMIKFGSRTELFVSRGLPFVAAVKIGQKVHAGSCVIGRFE